MGLRDTEEMLEACKADTIVLERENAALRKAAQHWRDQVDAALSAPAAEPEVECKVCGAREPYDRHHVHRGVYLTPEEAELAARALRSVRGDGPRGAMNALGDPGTVYERLRVLAERLEEATS